MDKVDVGSILWDKITMEKEIKSDKLNRRVNHATKD